MENPKVVAEQIRATYEGDEDMYEMTEGTGAVERRYQGTAADRKDMVQLGRKQELRRNFHFLSILGLSCCLIAVSSLTDCAVLKRRSKCANPYFLLSQTWEVIVTTLLATLTNGGTAGLIYDYIIVCIGFAFVYLSLAEMASMAPTSGGQYHWVGLPTGASSQLTDWLCVGL